MVKQLKKFTLGFLTADLALTISKKQAFENTPAARDEQFQTFFNMMETLITYSIHRQQKS
jgi:hypothetical protein